MEWFFVVTGFHRNNKPKCAGPDDSTSGREVAGSAAGETLSANSWRGTAQIRRLWLLFCEGHTTQGLKIPRANNLLHGLRRVRWSLVMPLVILYRFLFLRHVVFIGVTGSLGKTTTVELVFRVLSSRLSGFKGPMDLNGPGHVYRNIMRVRPWHSFCIQEISAAFGRRRVKLELLLSLLMPKIGIVTSVGTDHWSVFGSADAIAEEKGKMIAVLPETGAAILNADDPDVLGMRARTSAGVITVGSSPEACVRAQNIRCRWPEPLELDVVFDGKAYPVRTRLYGEQWVPCILAAIAVGLEMGIPIPVATEAIAGVPPTPKRMEPVMRSDGVTFIRDDFKAPIGSFEPALKVMKNASSRRKIAIIGTISDYPGAPKQAYSGIAKEARAVFDHTIFVGMHARLALGARRHSKDEAIQAFVSVRAASHYVARLLRPGDLVLVKGSESADRLGMLVEGERASGIGLSQGLTAPRKSLGLQDEDYQGIRAIIGLGNPGRRAFNARHNVGHRVLDQVAAKLGANWTSLGKAEVAIVQRNGAKAHLIKTMTGMNVCGPMLAELGNELGFGAEDVVVVLDDTDLPVGATRIRMRGSAGGHKGMLSILEAMGTDHVRRIKVGVGRPERSRALANYVLERFPPEDRPAIDKATKETANKVLSFLPHR